MVIGNGMKKAKWILPTLALGAMLCACFESGKDVAGTSEESEGIVALEGKMISGAAQKGPLVKGSSVVLRETSADGKLEPTGRKVETTTIDDKGRFGIDSVELESPYVLLSAEGYYTHEYDGERSECPMRLDAVTSLENRKVSNINLLTHFEYKRVLNLVKSGKAFAEAKKQAATEVLGAFGVKMEVPTAEDLNIFKSSEADRTLYNISKLIDSRSLWDPWDGEGSEYDRWAYYDSKDNIDCSRLQNFIDGFADDFADDGILSDTIMQWLVAEAYSDAKEFYHLEYIDESGMREKDAVDPGSYGSLSAMKKEYEFSVLLFLNYMGLEKCTESLWGEYRDFHRPILVMDDTDYRMVVKDSGYFLCNGVYWEMNTKGYIDSLKMKIDHESGTMTDPRDGKTYKTVSFEYEGKRYEWMAEDLKYKAASGLYSWTTALQIDQKYMKKAVEEGVLDSIHQGICPDGWHVFNDLEWKALIDYVGGVYNLIDETWKDVGVYYNRFDFNLKEPKDEKDPLSYHTYPAVFSAENDEEEIEIWTQLYNEGHQEDARKMVEYLREYGIHGLSTLNIWGVDYSMSKDPLSEAFVRCVKN